MLFSSLVSALVLTNAVLGSPQHLRNVEQVCEDPIGSILSTLTCIEEQDADCASLGYVSNFVKLHNGVDTHTKIGGKFIWQTGFDVSKIKLDINHQMNIGINKASIRYVETVTTTDGANLGFTKAEPSDEYPYSQVFVQHEHALVTVDNDCRIVMWDQYGDNKEQTDVDDAVDIIVLDMICKRSILPLDKVCYSLFEEEKVDPAPEQPTTDEDQVVEEMSSLDDTVDNNLV